MIRPRLSDWFWALAILDAEQHTMSEEVQTGGSSEYYDLPKGPNGEYPRTLQEVIKWWDDGRGMTWNQANIFKAAYRWDKKAGIQYNCEKAEWFARDTLNDIYKAAKKQAMRHIKSTPHPKSVR